MNHEAIASLRWPDDKEQIARLDLVSKQFWFAMQDARTMVFVGDTREFQRFWFWFYIVPLRIKRLMYRCKFW